MAERAQRQQREQTGAGRHAGTAATRRRRPMVQAKLVVGAVDDPLEREADAVAAQVLRAIAAPSVDPIDDTSRVRRSALADASAAEGHGLAGGDASPEVARRVERSAGGGRPLEPAVRDTMERGFGADFSGVRIHTDASAAELSRSLNARAFTRGSDVYFGDGEYQPSTGSGRELLAHELTHTLQQSSARVHRSAAPADSVSTDRSPEVRRWNLKTGVDLGQATAIRTITSGQAVFMAKDGSGDEIVVKGENYPISLINLATLVHKSVHDVDVIDSAPLDGTQKQKLLQKIGDPTVTSDPSWATLGAKPDWAKWNKTGLSPDAHARAMHQEQLGALALQVQAFAKGDDAKAQVQKGSFRNLMQSPKYVRQLGAAAAVDMFLGNADRVSATVTNLGNWMATADEKVHLIDNMDANARRSFSQTDDLFPPDMKEWAKDPEGYYGMAIDRLLQEVEVKDPGTIAWANGEGGFTRRFMIDDFRTGFAQTVDRLLTLYNKDKGSKAGREAKAQVKAIAQDEGLDYWEVLKARARYMKNPKQAASLEKTVAKRQKAIDKKSGRNG